MRRRAALALAGLAWTALLLAAGVTALGAVAVPSIGLSISDASRLWIATIVLLGTAALMIGGPVRLLDTLTTSAVLPRTTLLIVVGLLLATLATRGAHGVGGADSAGYLAQAQRWTAGALRVPLPRDAALDVSPSVQTPLGFRPDPTETMTVPTYPPGLPLLQAGALVVGGEAAAVRLLPAAAVAIAVLALFSLARRAANQSGTTPAQRGARTPLTALDDGGAVVGILAFVSLPAVLFQALQPMSDIPALAAWLTALACIARPGRLAPLIAVAATAVAVAIRPNLAPLTVAVAWQALDADRATMSPRARALLVTAAAAAAVLFVAGLQWRLYGSPLRSGYGAASELFALAHVAPNLALYPHWLRHSSSAPGLIGLAAGAGALLARAPADRRLRPLVAAAAIVAALYLIYVPFDSWTYLRFVLLAIAVAAIGLAVLVQAVLIRLPGRCRVPAFALCALLAGVPNLGLAQELGVFAVGAREARYQAAGRFIGEHLPQAAMVLAGQHSASVAYYARRPILRADLIDPAALERVASGAETPARSVGVVLDVAEVKAFRLRHAGSALAALDWPPRAEIGRPVTTRVWLASDRLAFHAGRRVPTTRIETTRR